jgi:hypothetical protein
MDDENKVPASQTGDEGKDLSQGKKIERTPEEIARYNLKKKADEAEALGIDPKEVLGTKTDDTEVPAWYKAEKAKDVQKSSLQLAEAISDEDLKERVKTNLGKIVPSDNPEDDFRMALGAASASKNKQVLEEMNRYSKPRVVSSGASQPANVEEEFVPTAEEAVMMAKPYNLSKEKVLAARKANQAKN